MGSPLSSVYLFIHLMIIINSDLWTANGTRHPTLPHRSDFTCCHVQNVLRCISLMDCLKFKLQACFCTSWFYASYGKAHICPKRVLYRVGWIILSLCTCRRDIIFVGYFTTLTVFKNIQSVPERKVNILGGHSISHSKIKRLYEHVSHSERFPIFGAQYFEFGA
jgi:hypothetical protein